MERLDKLLSHRGWGSRQEVRDRIRRRRVTVDGAVVTDPATPVDPVRMSICVDGEELARRQHLHLMLHKPAGVITAARDARDRTVMDLVPARWRWTGLHPVGRLDKDTEGLLILSTDGALSHRLTGPRWHVEKEYLALLDRPAGEQDAAAFAAGLPVDAELTARPARLEPGPALPHPATGELLPSARVTLDEGKYHQVRRMFAARGCQVQYLRRLRMGPISLDPTLPPGDLRPLSPAEEAALYAAARLRAGDIFGQAALDMGGPPP